MSTYKRHRFPPAIISYAVWVYYRFNLSYHDVEGLLAERGVIASREAIRHWYAELVDVYLQSKRNGATAKRFFKRILKRHGDEPRNIVTDKLRSYGVAHRELMPDTTHNTTQYANNRAEQSQSLPRFMGMRRQG
ncbi:MAG: putative transposase [Porticoccus sp.]|jgi:putative transposase